MAATQNATAKAIRTRIGALGLSIYDEVPADCLYSLEDLESILATLIGTSLDYPIRTRSKIAKAAVAKALGYQVPTRFARTRPRFPGQHFDVYVQQSDNVQVWNEEVDPYRRYAFLRANADHQIVAVRVITGEELALLDRTGTLTSKYQARRKPAAVGSRLVVPDDTVDFVRAFRPGAVDPLDLSELSASARPVLGTVYPIADIYRRLLRLVGTEVADPGHTQDRLRGVALQQLAVPALGLGWYSDAGQFPDVLSQILELKLQTSATIDLGLISPDDPGALEGVGRRLAHKDVRYGIVYAERLTASTVRVTDIVVTTGEAFFTEFRRFGGLVRNRKLQIRLPRSFFNV